MTKIFTKKSEHAEQAALFQWVNMSLSRYPKLMYLFAIPNGGKRHIGTAMKLKAEGVKAGVPDLFLPVSVDGYHGLFIEMKIQSNNPTDVQFAWHKALRQEGYMVWVCYSWQQAKDVLVFYLSGKIISLCDLKP